MSDLRPPLSAALDAFGLDAVVTPPLGDPVETRVIWRANDSAEGLELLRTMSPLGRLGTPDEVAAVVAFVAGPDGGWLTGQNINASGGV